MERSFFVLFSKLKEFLLPSSFETCQVLENLVWNISSVKQNQYEVRLLSSCHLLLRRLITIGLVFLFSVWLSVFNDLVSLIHV